MLSGIRILAKRLTDKPSRSRLSGTGFEPTLGWPCVNFFSTGPLFLPAQMRFTIACRCRLPQKKTKLGLSACLHACLNDWLTVSLID